MLHSNNVCISLKAAPWKNIENRYTIKRNQIYQIEIDTVPKKNR